MSNKLRLILSESEHKKHATQNGRAAHKKMQFLTAESIENTDDDFLKKLFANKELNKFFTADSKVEVPIAGYINGRFVSRRIDRLSVDDTNKVVYVLDYKTDTDKTAFHDEYVKQIKEYKKLLRDIKPDYKIYGFILWLNDFSLEEIA